MTPHWQAEAGPWTRGARTWTRRPLRSWLPGTLGTVVVWAFIILKLTGITNWSWWWVLSPLWIPPAGLLALAILAALALAVIRSILRAWLRTEFRKAFR